MFLSFARVSRHKANVTLISSSAVSSCTSICQTHELPGVKNWKNGKLEWSPGGNTELRAVEYELLYPYGVSLQKL